MAFVLGIFLQKNLEIRTTAIESPSFFIFVAQPTILPIILKMLARLSLW